MKTIYKNSNKKVYSYIHEKHFKVLRQTNSENDELMIL
jgi:hypothetical protein